MQSASSVGMKGELRVDKKCIHAQIGGCTEEFFHWTYGTPEFLASAAQFKKQNPIPVIYDSELVLL